VNKLKKIFYYILSFLFFELILVFLYWGTTSIKEKNYLKIKFKTQKEITELNFKSYNLNAENFAEVIQINSETLSLLYKLNAGTQSISKYMSILSPFIKSAESKGFSVINFYSQDFKNKLDCNSMKSEKSSEKDMMMMSSMITTCYKKFALEIGMHSVMYKAIFPIKLANNYYAYLELGFNPSQFEEKLKKYSGHNYLHLIYDRKLEYFNGKTNQIFKGLSYPLNSRNDFISSKDLSELMLKSGKVQNNLSLIHKNHSQSFKANGKDYIISYFPLKSIDAENIRYLVEFS